MNELTLSPARDPKYDFAAFGDFTDSPEMLRRQAASVAAIAADQKRQRDEMMKSPPTNGKNALNISTPATTSKGKPNTIAKARSRASKLERGLRRVPDAWVQPAVLEHFHVLAKKQNTTVAALIARVLTRAVPRHAKPAAHPNVSTTAAA